MPLPLCSLCRLVLHEALHLRPREEAAHGGPRLLRYCLIPCCDWRQNLTAAGTSKHSHFTATRAALPGRLEPGSSAPCPSLGLWQIDSNALSYFIPCLAGGDRAAGHRQRGHHLSICFFTYPASFPSFPCSTGGDPAAGHRQRGHHLPRRIHARSRELVHVRRRRGSGACAGCPGNGCFVAMHHLLLSHMLVSGPRAMHAWPVVPGCRGCLCHMHSSNCSACHLLTAALTPVRPRISPASAGATSCTSWTLCAAAWCSSPSSGPSSSCATPAVRAA